MNGAGREGMRTSLTISALVHAAVLAWSVLAFVAKPYRAESTESMPVDIISVSDFSKMTLGARNGARTEKPNPLAEKVAERRPTDDPTAKVVETKETKSSTDTPAPEPKPKPPANAEKKPPEPKRDLIAEALKKDDAKKPEPKKTEAKTPTPPKKPVQQQPQFDPRKVEALLDKRDPQRLAATGDALRDTVSLGASNGTAAQLSQSELDALRARLAQLWNPPAGASNPEELVVQVRIKLSPDGRLAAPPMVLTSGTSPLFQAARDSAVRAVFRGQPFDMLKPEHYEQWKDVEITFDPRDLVRG